MTPRCSRGRQATELRGVSHLRGNIYDHASHRHRPALRGDPWDIRHRGSYRIYGLPADGGDNTPPLRGRMARNLIVAATWKADGYESSPIYASGVPHRAHRRYRPMHLRMEFVSAAFLSRTTRYGAVGSCRLRHGNICLSVAHRNITLFLPRADIPGHRCHGALVAACLGVPCVRHRTLARCGLHCVALRPSRERLRKSIERHRPARALRRSRQIVSLATHAGKACPERRVGAGRRIGVSIRPRKSSPRSRRQKCPDHPPLAQ